VGPRRVGQMDVKKVGVGVEYNCFMAFKKWFKDRKIANIFEGLKQHNRLIAQNGFTEKRSQDRQFF